MEQTRNHKDQLLGRQTHVCTNLSGAGGPRTWAAASKWTALSSSLFPPRRWQDVRTAPSADGARAPCCPHGPFSVLCCAPAARRRSAPRAHTHLAGAQLWGGFSCPAPRVQRCPLRPRTAPRPNTSQFGATEPSTAALRFQNRTCSLTRSRRTALAFPLQLEVPSVGTATPHHTLHPGTLLLTSLGVKRSTCVLSSQATWKRQNGPIKALISPRKNRSPTECHRLQSCRGLSSQ